MRGVYNWGYDERAAEYATQAEAQRKLSQSRIDAIEKEALDQIASRPKVDLEKVLADVRKTNPACSLIVPRSVSDALRKH